MLQGEIIQRDGFHCRYCTGRVIPTPIMELLGGIYPEIFPFQSANWRAGVTHPAIAARSPAIDHVKPVAHGGALVDPANLATACYPCNSIKADFTLEQLGWTLAPIRGTEWRGLTEWYRPLWERAKKPKPGYHEAWLRALCPPST